MTLWLWAVVGRGVTWAGDGCAWLLYTHQSSKFAGNGEDCKGLGHAGLGHTTRWCSCAALAFKGAVQEIQKIFPQVKASPQLWFLNLLPGFALHWSTDSIFLGLKGSLSISEAMSSFAQ